MIIRRAKALPPRMKTIVQSFVPLPAVGRITSLIDSTVLHVETLPFCS